MADSWCPFPVPRSTRAGRARGLASPPRARSRSAVTDGSCSRWTRAATRFLSSGSSRTARSSWFPTGTSPGGAEPVSVAEHDGLVYVANAGAGGSNYTGFTLSPSGRLRALEGCNVPLPDNAQPGDVLFNPAGTNLVGARVNSSQIDSFSVGPDGRLTAAPGSPFAAQAAGPFGSEFRPTNASQLFVSNAHAGVGAGRTAQRSAPRATARFRRSRAHHSPTTRPRHVGSRSRTTVRSCSRSTPARAASRGTRSRPTANADAARLDAHRQPVRCRRGRRPAEP